MSDEERGQRIPDAITDAVAQQEWLDPIGDVVQPLVHDALQAAGLHVRNFLHGTTLGHPLHPVLTDIPIGAWTVALALDIADATGADAARAGADVAVAIGLAGAAASAVVGLADWSQTDGKPKRVGVAHAVTNVAATLLYTTSMVMRSTGSRQAARMTALAGYATVMAGAFLGGHLVYGQQIGVNHENPNDEGKPKNWTKALADEELKRKPQKGDADGVSVVLVRDEGEICALSEVCPHLGGPLAEGKVEDGTIRCPWHGSRFDLRSGAAVEGPTAYPARCFDVRVREGNIEVRAQREEGD